MSTARAPIVEDPAEAAGRRAHAAGAPIDACPWSEDRTSLVGYALSEDARRQAWRAGLILAELAL